MKIAFQMESPADSDRENSASLLLVQEACLRGYDVFHYLPESLSIDNGGVFASAASMKVDLATGEYYELGNYERTDLASFNAVFIRQDPPFDMGYITTTYILEYLEKSGVFVSNDPFWVRNTPDKLFIFDFRQYMPPTLVSRDMSAIEKFYAAHQDIVIKPLYNFHGNGITRSSSSEDAQKRLAEFSEPLMFQPFLEEVKDGNIRIVLFDGEIIGALKTLPQGDEFRVYRDSVDVVYELSKDEQFMAEEIGVVMKERGLHFVGLDLIGPYLTEVNVGSVGSLARLNKLYDKKHEALLWDVLEPKISDQT